MNGKHRRNKQNGQEDVVLLPRMLGIVGHCPNCGAPIYGNSIVKEQDTPPIRYSCFCLTRKSIAEDHLMKAAKFENTVRTS
jgi:hypothetical protein